MDENCPKCRHFHGSKILSLCILFLLFGPSSADSLHHRDLLSYNGDSLAAEPWLKFENPRLENAYIALQAWKDAMLSDHKVAGIDINHGDIAGSLPHELGLLYDLALFHINSNRFCGSIPQSFMNLKLLFELDLSNNRFAGKFPEPILLLPSLKYLKISGIRECLS